ncbi:MAG TPA: DUF262 domain-containing protein [Solirubrobacteraceae bacterium]|jgi:hypothetical protein
MEIIPDKRKVVGLVEHAHEGKICLPNFQRDFVWTREEVADLVRSIIRGYFIGSLLLLRCDPNKPPFAPELLRGAEPPFKDARPEYLVLDGQQRLSSLMYALTAPNLSLKDSSTRRWFFVNLDVLLQEPDSDEVVFDRSKRELRGLDNIEVQYAQRTLPCTALLTERAFSEWVYGFEDWLREHSPADVENYRADWRDGWTKAVIDFRTFEVPLVELPRIDEEDGDAIGRVCAIFEKLNSTGVDLSVYDLLTARLYRDGIRLHDLWEEAVGAHDRLRAWSNGKANQHKFGVLVLRTLALLRGLDPKPRILIDLQPEDFEGDWRRAAAAIERALELVELVGQDGFGVFAEKWLPGYGLLPILAALRARIEDGGLGQVAREELRRWYWCNVFLERYSSAVESKSRKDYQEMTRHWLEDGPEPEVFREAQAWIGSPSFRVRDSASYASAVYSGIFCLLALRHARDWRRGEDIRLQELQDHHIFPQAYLRRHGITKRIEVNTIANRTLISDETNGKIKDRAPAEYLPDRHIFPEGPQPGLMAPHFLDGAAIQLLTEAAEDLSDQRAADLYERFLQTRQTALIEEIRHACGITARKDPTEANGHDEPAADVEAGIAPLFNVDEAGSRATPQDYSLNSPPYGA